MKCIVVVVVLIGALITRSCQGQRIPLPIQNFPNNQNQPQNNPNQPQSQQQPSPQNASGGPPNNAPNLQVVQQQQKADELANVKDESIKRVLLELSSLQTPSQMGETMARVASLVGPLFVADFDQRRDEVTTQSRDSGTFPQRLLSAVTDIQGEEVKALVLEKKLESLHASDFAFLPLAIQYGLQEDVLRNLSGTKLASVVKVNPGDAVVAMKVSKSLMNQPEQQIEFLQSLGTKLLPGVQRIIMLNLLDWWGDPHTWKDRELGLLIAAGSPLIAFMPQRQLQVLDDELADRFVTMLGQTQDIARGWWRKPMSLKKAWFDVAKGARYFGAVHEWSFRRMQKLSFLLEGATPEDLELIPPVPEIKGLVIGNHYTELQARVVFNAFYNSPPLSQEDLQEFQFHVLDLIPTQLQRFDFADSFGTLDEMFAILDRQKEPAYPTVLQISYFMWPIVNTSNAIMNIAPPSTWQKRELSQLGKMFFLLPKSVMSQIKPDLINWDSNILSAIRSSHLSQFQIWKLTSQILPSVDERLRPDYIFMIPSPFQKGIPTHNISQALLGTTTVRPEILRALIEETSGMLISQKSVILQRIQNRVGESIIIRMMISNSNPSEMFELLNPKLLLKSMPNIIKTIMEMPETGRFGLTSIQTKLLPTTMLSLWLKSVRDNSQITRWTAEDLLGRSSIGGANELNFAILGLSCRDIEIINAWDILSVIMHYRHELYALRKFEPSLKFNVNLRSCVLLKFIEYMKQKRFLNNIQSTGHALDGINEGEIEAIGGEILSTIPAQALEQLDLMTRENIIKEIGKLEMTELFSLIPLDSLLWYGRTLFRDIEISSDNPDTLPGDSSVRKKRQLQAGTLTDLIEDNKNANNANNATNKSDSTNATETDHVTNAPRVPVGSLEENNGTINARSGGSDPATAATPAPSTKRHGGDLESLNGMGNLLCYADNLFQTKWPRSLLKDVLEGKTAVGEKTCCISKAFREKWFEALKDVYGSDTSSWNEFDLTAIGDLLIVLPEQDLMRISMDSLAKATTPITRQSAFAMKIPIPGMIKRVQFVTACVEALGNEGMEYMTAYKILMKRIFQASQWMVNTVKTTQELIRDGVGRTGRIPRWAEHTLVKRQVTLSTGSDGSPFSGTTFSPAPQMFSSVPIQTQYTYVQPQSGFIQAPAYMQVAYSPQSQVFQPMQVGNFAPSPTTVFQQQPGVVPQQQFYLPPQQPSIITQQQQPLLDPSLSGAVTGTNAEAGGASAAAGGAAAGSAVGGGSFSGSFAQANTNAGNANANGFAASGGGSFSQTGGIATGTIDPNQAGVTGGGSFSAANANTNTFSPRGISNQNQQPGIMTSSGQTPQQQNPQNPAAIPSAPVQQQQGPNPGVPSQQQQNPNSNIPSQQPQPSIAQGPSSSNVPPQQQQPPSSSQPPTTPGQSAGSPPGKQQQNIPASGQQQIGEAGVPQLQSVPGTPSNQQVAPIQTGVVPGQSQSQTQQQFQTRNAPTQPQQQQPTASGPQQASPGQQMPPVSALSQQTGAGGPGGMQQPGGPQNSAGVPGGIQQPSAPQNGPGSPGPMQQPGVPQQQTQTMSTGSLPQQTLQQQQSAIPSHQTPLQPGANNMQMPSGRAGDADNSQINPSNLPPSNLPSGNQRIRSLNFGGPLQDDTHNSEITCHGIKAAGSAAIGLSIDDLNKLTQADLFDCVGALGRIEWDDETKSKIVTLLKQKLEFNQDSINALTLIELGDLVTAFSANPQTSNNNAGFAVNTSTPNITVHSDVSVIDLTLPLSLDVLSILGQQVTDPLLLKSLAEKFNQDNRIFPGFSEGIARPENLRIVVMSLGNIICGLSNKIVNSIFETDASLFIDTSRILGRLEGCSSEVLSTLATHAVRPSNYGPPRLWGQEDVTTIGVVFAGLKPEVISTIPPDAMQGLTPLAVKNLPPTSLLAFTTEQLQKMSYDAARAFTPAQFNSFSSAEAQVVQSVLQVQNDLFHVQGASQQPNDDLVVRNIGNRDGSQDGNQTESVEGRAKDGSSETGAPSGDTPTVVVVDESDILAGDTDNTTAPESNSPTSSASSKFLSSFLLLLTISVIEIVLF